MERQEFRVCAGLWENLWVFAGELDLKQGRYNICTYMYGIVYARCSGARGKASCKCSGISVSLSWVANETICRNGQRSDNGLSKCLNV